MIEKQRKKKMALSKGRSTKNEDKEADQVNHLSISWKKGARRYFPSLF